VFTKLDGAALHPAQVTGWFADLDREASLSPVRLHDLRHDIATCLLTSGMEMKASRRFWLLQRRHHRGLAFAHGWMRTRPRDLSVADRPTDLTWTKRRWQCQDPNCAAHVRRVAAADPAEIEADVPASPVGWSSGRRPRPDGDPAHP
jgi:hypothetical protein